ncbi:MAG: phospholipid carrier-dependent glycosyltransferase [Candidatus Aureabacteria bacterium]|nr:phospholipid carrier-dependent glycosyltransferase [Candidatus Auribacterota bacterium]
MEKIIRYLLPVFAIAWILSMSFFLAWNLETEHFDGLDYLICARSIEHKGQGPWLYSFTRPPGIPLLLSWVLPHIENADKKEGTPLRIPHLFSWLLSVLCLMVLFLIFLEIFKSKTWALWGACLLGTNRIYFYYSSFVNTDIPALLFLMTGMLVFLMNENSSNRWTAAFLWGFFFFMASLTRFCFLLTPLFLTIYFIYRKIIFKKNTHPAEWGSLFIPLILTGVFLYVLIERVFHFPFVTILKNITHDLLFVHGIHAEKAESCLEYLSTVFYANGWLMMALIPMGLYHALIRKNKTDVFFMAYLAYYGITVCLAPHKEPRYLLPVFPAFYYFSLSFLRDGYARYQNRFILFKNKICLFLLSSVFLGFLLMPVMHEWRQFQDPFFFTTYIRQLTDKLKTDDPKQQIFWYPESVFYPFHPRRYQLFSGDDFYYLFHLYSTHLSFFLNTKIQRIPYQGRYPRTPVFPGITRFMKEHDKVVINPYDRNYSSCDRFFPNQPLMVGELYLRHFHKIGDSLSSGEADNREILFEAEEDRSFVRLRTQEKGTVLFSSKGLSGEWSFFLKDKIHIIGYVSFPANKEITLSFDDFPVQVLQSSSFIVADLKTEWISVPGSDALKK